MKKDPQNNTFLNIITNSCVYSAFSLIIINLICFFSDGGRLMKLWANALFFLICFIISLIIYCLKRKNTKETSSFRLMLNRICSLFVVVFFLLNTLVYMIENGVLWTIYTILLVALFSVVICIMKKFVKIKSFLLCSILYFFVVGIFYFAITVTIAGFGEGNRMIILLSAYTGIYALCAFIVYLIKRSLEKDENVSKAYTKQFQ